MIYRVLFSLLLLLPGLATAQVSDLLKGAAAGQPQGEDGSGGEDHLAHEILPCVGRRYALLERRSGVAERGEFGRISGSAQSGHGSLGRATLIGTRALGCCYGSADTTGGVGGWFFLGFCADPQVGVGGRHPRAGVRFRPRGTTLRERRRGVA